MGRLICNGCNLTSSHRQAGRRTTLTQQPENFLEQDFCGNGSHITRTAAGEARCRNNPLYDFPTPRVEGRIWSK